MGICIDTIEAVRNRNRLISHFRINAWISIFDLLRDRMRTLGRNSADSIMALLNLIELWRARSTQRRKLRSLDDRLLKDIGASRCDAEAEYRKPFWRE
jgi:uncharacterized protein YjiS (DUF1127 family)